METALHAILYRCVSLLWWIRKVDVKAGAFLAAYALPFLVQVQTCVLAGWGVQVGVRVLFPLSGARFALLRGERECTLLRS
ncbi:hypothetical protein B0H13DRAFT_2390372 [Mycena leptocephala]|nr:hypothetical protein B0H13DRAFT_2390372 [Mycena leptocephala]